MLYRPTVHYAYHPCPDAVLSVDEFAGRNWRVQSKERVIRDEIVNGVDELGVLLMGHAKCAYWYGSQPVDPASPAARALQQRDQSPGWGWGPAGMVWALLNPQEGVVEPDEMDYRLILEIAAPYLGEVVGVYGDWTPLQDREWPFPEDVDRDDPWQFKNIRVT